MNGTAGSDSPERDDARAADASIAPPLTERLEAVNALADPARLALYTYVSRSSEPVSRDTVAQEHGLSRSTAAFHLERLAAAGLLDVEYRRTNGRSGPGSGRPTKLYRRATTEVLLSLPQRHYDMAGDLLAGAVEQSAQTGEPVREALRELAMTEGRSQGAVAASLPDALEENGFEPLPEGDDIVLGNCPFHRLAQDHTAVVCEMNLWLVRGMAEGARDNGCRIENDPGAAGCCIRISPILDGKHTEGSQDRSS
jgi:predicted ArsR family transcriptional regulator